MFGRGNSRSDQSQDNVMRLLEVCESQGVELKDILGTLKKPLDAYQKEVLIAAQIRAAKEAEAQEAAARAEAAEANAKQAREATKQVQIKAERDKDIARSRADEANAAANREREARARVEAERAKSAQEHTQRLLEQEKIDLAANTRMVAAKKLEEANNTKKAGAERENLLVANKDQDEKARQRDKDRLVAEKRAQEERIAADKRAQEDAFKRDMKAKEKLRELEQKSLDAKAQAEKESIERLAKADAERREADNKAHAEKMRLETEAAKVKAAAQAEKDIKVLDHKVELWQDPNKREALHAEDRHQSELRTKENVAGIQTKIEGVKKAIFEFTDNKERRKAVGTFVVGTTVATAGGILLIRHVLPVIRQLVENHLFTPVLIEESSYSVFGSWFARKNKNKDVEKFENLHFDPAHQERINEIKTTLINTKKNKGYYLNYLFYGLPGTGKTATARALAYESGMDFAFMTGGSVLDLLRSGKGIQRLKEVFSWAKKSKKGLVLFVDEADAFLGDPTGDLFAELNAMLKAFLNYSGTESKDYCIVLSSNHPNKIAKAVLSRIGYRQQLRFDAPSLETRKKIVAHFMQKYLGKFMPKNESAVTATERINYVAEQTQGFVGRDISYLMLGVEKALLAKGMTTLNQTILEKVVTEAVAGYNQAQHLESYA